MKKLTHSAQQIILRAKGWMSWIICPVQGVGCSSPWAVFQLLTPAERARCYTEGINQPSDHFVRAVRKCFLTS